MTRRLLESRLVFAVVAFAFLVALGCFAVQGTGIPVTGHMLLVAQPVNVAHGPTMPPDPWIGVTHGPTMPPDPWIGVTRGPLVAHGPTMPPDPWIGVTHGPTMPPDPWIGFSGAGSPTLAA